MYAVVGLGIRFPVDPEWIKRRIKEGTLKTYIDRPLPVSTELTFIKEEVNEVYGGIRGKTILRPKMEKKR
jgi:hypothetical protein